MKLLSVSKNLFIIILSLSFIVIPTFGILHAQIATKQSGIVTGCFDTSKNPPEEVPCDSFNQLLGGVKNVINYAVTFALSFSVIVIAWAGWLYMTSGGDSGKVKKAHDMFTSVAWGIAWVLGAWLVVNLIVTALVKDTEVTNFLKN